MMDEIINIVHKETGEEIIIDYKKIQKAALILRAVNHKLRQDIIKLLNENGQMAVTDIYVKLRIEQSVASQHLAILRKAGVVNSNRTGKFIHYSVNQERIKDISSFVEKLINHPTTS